MAFFARNLDIFQRFQEAINTLALTDRIDHVLSRCIDDDVSTDFEFNTERYDANQTKYYSTATQIHKQSNEIGESTLLNMCDNFGIILCATGERESDVCGEMTDLPV